MGSVRNKRVSVSEMMRIPPIKPKALFGCRHVQVLFMTFGFLSCYAVRVTMSVTLEAMTNSTKANPQFEEFHWDQSTKDTILSSFFWGYICTQILGNIIAQRWGAQKVLSGALAINGLLTLSVHSAAHYGGWEYVCVTRIIAGFAQGTVMPTLHTLLSKWSPSDERGRLATFVYSGGWIGNVISLLSSGYLSASVLGWPSCFYCWGIISLIAALCVIIFVKESPADHPNIPLDEKEFIEVSLGVTETDQKLSTPWVAILTSVPVWALLITQSVQNWGFWMLLTKMPSYMNSALGYDIQQNGTMSALPYLTAWILSFPFSYFSDLCIRKKIITLEVSRKICNTIGQWIPAIALICLGYINKEQPELAVAILIIAVASNIAAYCGHNVNHMDLSPNFAGALMGFTNTAANICAILAPLICSVIVPDPSNILQWRSIFFLSAGLYIIGNLIFVLFGKGKVQMWNDPVKKQKQTTMYQIGEIMEVDNSEIQKTNDPKIP
ncbi:putative inorganic phosphate cotransporter [Vespa mandarinia]|uniref:putative inorganic phosphate cotransporter n=1 Tax=Vespa mandarinia TaxID=7446 RepID=UPI00161581D2|nr:putative inorganic phosphate cotransporter [Vespa mandarinia]